MPGLISQGCGALEGSNSPTLSPQQFHLLCPQHKEGSSRVSLRELSGCDWHIQVSWEAGPMVVGFDGAQPATLQGASQALGTS